MSETNRVRAWCPMPSPVSLRSPTPEQARGRLSPKGEVTVRRFFVVASFAVRYPAPMNLPAILLIRPQMGENIGATARAMANFGLRELRLVAPRDGWPNPKAADMAGRALDVIDGAQLYETTEAALAECQYVLATTARERAMNLPVMDVRQAMAEIATRTARGEKCGIMFGPERTGLENEEVVQANAVVTIPVAPEYTSLNIAQAVVLVCYEWLMAEGVASLQSPVASKEEILLKTGDWRLETGDSLPASREELHGLFGQLEAALDAINFWRIPAKKEIMWRNIRAGLTRAELTSQEISTWRGMVRGLSEGFR